MYCEYLIIYRAHTIGHVYESSTHAHKIKALHKGYSFLCSKLSYICYGYIYSGNNHKIHKRDCFKALIT